MKYVAFNINNLKAILESRNLSERDLAKMMYGPKTHQTFQSIFTKSFGIQKLLVVCNVLNDFFGDIFVAAFRIFTQNCNLGLIIRWLDVSR